MKAARLHEYQKPLKIEDVPIPDVKAGEVLVKIAGAGVCHTDLHFMSGVVPLSLPLTLGHENAGYVEKVGSGVSNLEKGDPVVVYGSWGCGQCRFCRQGEENICVSGNQVGVTKDGGYAQYLIVPKSDYLIKLEGVDPIEAAPLACAGITAYHGIKKAFPFLYPGSTVVIIGLGGLGHFAVQIMKALSPVTRVIGVDVAEDKLQLALELGADFAIDGKGDVGNEIKRLTREGGAQAVIDTVGSDSTLGMATACLVRKSIVVILGAAGGTLPYCFNRLPFETVVAGSFAGTCAELEELSALASAGKICSHVQRFPLDDINEVLHFIEKGNLLGRAVITP